mgnify:CR=1 FL=1
MCATVAYLDCLYLVSATVPATAGQVTTLNMDDVVVPIQTFQSSLTVPRGYFSMRQQFQQPTPQIDPAAKSAAAPKAPAPSNSSATPANTTTATNNTAPSTIAAPPAKVAAPVQAAPAGRFTVKMQACLSAAVPSLMDAGAFIRSACCGSEG